MNDQDRIANLEATVAVLCRILAPQIRAQGFKLPANSVTRVTNVGGGSANVEKHGSKPAPLANVEKGTSRRGG